MNKKIHHNIHKECTMPKTASDNPSSHYRVLKEHTPTRYSPHHRAFTSRLGSDLQTLTPSPGQLFQPTRPDPHPANPWICTVRKSGNPNPPSRNTTGLEPEDQGRSARTRSPLPEPNPHRALRGRRRGALTGNKLRRCKAWVKSPGHGSQFCTSSQVTGPRSHANRSAEGGFPPNR